MSAGEEKKDGAPSAEPGSDARPTTEIVWPIVLYLVHLHLGGLFGIYYVFTEAKILTTLFALLVTTLSILGATAGAHRLWAHRSYKACDTLKVLLMLCHTMLGQCTIYDWVLNHRLHHKYLGTDIDPYNNKRGFFHAHIVSHIRKERPDFKTYAATIDMSDIEADSIVMFQKRYYWVLMPVLSILLPWNAPVEYWNESILTSLLITIFLRGAIAIQYAMLINTAIHVWSIDEDKSKNDSNLLFFLTKSYWPQYHYMVPWDYQTGEYGNYSRGCTSTAIRIWAAMGWATELRTLDSTSVKRALIKSVETNKPMKECLQSEENYSRLYINTDQHLRPPNPFLIK